MHIKKIWFAVMLSTASMVSSATELSSVYARFTIDPQRYEDFKKYHFQKPSIYNDWQSWYDGKKMYRPLKVSTTDLNTVVWDTGAQFIKGWNLEYEKEKQILKIASLSYSENYADMLVTLSAFRQVENFRNIKEPSSSEDFIVVYPYVWSKPKNPSDYNAFLIFEKNKSVFKPSPNSKQLNEANIHLGGLLKKIQGQSD
jgi:hypothetical protein